MAYKFPDEWYEQAAVIEWVEKQHPWLIDHTIYIMADIKCSVHVGAMLNKMGRRPGRSDLFFAWPNQLYHGLFIEMKTKKGIVAKEQSAFIERMCRIDYYACVCRGTEEAIEVIKAYLNNKL